jgi:hypothetical protein
MVYPRIGAYDAPEPAGQPKSVDGGKRAGSNSGAIGGAAVAAPPDS